VLLVAGILLTVGLSGRAQSQAPAPPTFKSGVDLVRMDIRVTGSDGRPLTDVRPEEIDVRENGQRLPVVLFQRVTEPAGAYVEEAMRAVSAEVSSNDAFPRGHLYILVFDQQHITAGNEQRARQAAEQFLRVRVRPTDRVALYALPGPGPQIGFTTDKARVINELSAVRGTYERIVTTPQLTMNIYEAHRILQGDEKAVMTAVERMRTEAVGDVSGRPVGEGTASGLGNDEPATARRIVRENAQSLVNRTDHDARQVLQQLADVIAGFRDIDGRKTVLYFSEGFVQDNLTRELEVVAAAAAQSYCVFYAFDLNRRTEGVSEAFAAETVLSSEVQARIAPMGTLATETDGTLILDAGGRADRVLDAIADQAGDYYLVGFEPSAAARAARGKYQRISVRINRPGATVSARTGYALPRENLLTDKRRSINNVLGAPFVQQGLKVDYTTYQMKGTESGKHRIVLSLTAALPVRSKAGETADVVFVARDVRDGRVVASGTDTIPLPAQPRPGSSTGAGVWRVQFAVPPGSFLMRAVVREPGGLAGSADRRIDVRPLDGPELAVSDLVVGSRMSALPVRPRAYTGDGLNGVIETYGRTPVQLEDLKVRIDLRKTGETGVVKSTQAELLDVEDDGSGLSRRARFQLPLDTVPSGDYTVHAVVSARGETVAERTRQVEIVEASERIAIEDDPAAFERVTPLDVVNSDLGRKYVTWLQGRVNNTGESDAARHGLQGRWELVELQLQRLPSQGGLVPSALRGLALFVREDFAAASKALKDAFEAEPQSSLTTFFLGWAHEGAGNSREAVSAWRTAVHLDPTLVSAHIALADAYLRLNEPALARQALRAGLTALPNSVEIKERLARLDKNPGGE
jgi:VWFA-related protein